MPANTVLLPAPYLPPTYFPPPAAAPPPLVRYPSVNSVGDVTVAANSKLAIDALFTGQDPTAAPSITFYNVAVLDSAGQSSPEGQLLLDGTPTTRRTFSPSEFLRLSYVSGALGSADRIDVSAGNGSTTSNAASILVSVTGSVSKNAVPAATSGQLVADKGLTAAYFQAQPDTKPKDPEAGLLEAAKTGPDGKPLPVELAVFQPAPQPAALIQAKALFTTALSFANTLAAQRGDSGFLIGQQDNTNAPLAGPTLRELLRQQREAQLSGSSGGFAQSLASKATAYGQFTAGLLASESLVNGGLVPKVTPPVLF